MMSSVCLFLLASALAPAIEPTTGVAPTVTVEATTTVNVLITDRRGKPLPSARVVVFGASTRQGDTDKAGRIVFTHMKAGSYVLRVERDQFITFEKDFDVRGEKGPIPVVAAISPLASLPARPSNAQAYPPRRTAIPASSR